MKTIISIFLLGISLEGFTQSLDSLFKLRLKETYDYNISPESITRCENELRENFGLEIPCYSKLSEDFRKKLRRNPESFFLVTGINENYAYGILTATGEGFWFVNDVFFILDFKEKRLLLFSQVDLSVDSKVNPPSACHLSRVAGIGVYLAGGSTTYHFQFIPNGKLERTILRERGQSGKWYQCHQYWGYWSRHQEADNPIDNILKLRLEDWNDILFAVNQKKCPSVKEIDNKSLGEQLTFWFTEHIKEFSPRQIYVIYPEDN